VTALAPAGHLITTAGDISRFLAMELSAPIANAPLTPADVTLSLHELLPNLQAPAASDPRTVSPCSSGTYFIACQECGAAWWYGNQSVPLGPHGDSTLGSWVQMSGGGAGYGSMMRVAPDAGVATAVLSTANPDGSSNPHNNYNGQAITALTYDAANALNNPAVPWTSQPLPTALEGFMALLNNGVTSTTALQTFSQTFVNLNPSLVTSLQNLSSSLGTCSSFTVQRINSKSSATVTLQCAYGSLPMTFTSTSAAPYLVTNFKVLSTPIPAPAAGVPGGHASLALMGISGNAIPTAFSTGDGHWTATDLGETSGDPYLQLDSRTAGTTAVPGDFDCDGRGDIAVTGGSGWNTIPVAFSNGDGYSDIALTSGTGWNTIPIAFSNGDGTFHGQNLGVVSGYTQFTSTAQVSTLMPVGL
jgi:hypothetical protein